MNKKFFIFIFIFAFVIRFLFFSFFVKDKFVLWQFDSRVYKEVAEQIIENKTITNADGSSHFYRLPGYSIFLAATNIFNDFNNSLIIQIILSCFIPILIFYLSLMLFPANVLLAKLAALLSCFDVGFVVFSGLAMTDGLFLLFFLIFLIFYFYKRTRSRIKSPFLAFKKLFISGIFLGLASMFRPVGHYLIFLVIVLILLGFNNPKLYLFKFDRVKLLIKFKNIACIFLGWFVAVLPWLLRNYLLTGCLFFSTLPGIHFIKHGAARICMQKDNISYMVALSKVNKKWEESINNISIKKNRKLNDAEVSVVGERLAFGYFLKYPLVALKISIRNVLKTCFSLYSSEILFLDSGKLPDYKNKSSLLGLFKRFLFPKVNNKLVIPIIYFEIIFFIFLIIGFFGFAYNSIYSHDYRLVFFKLIFFILLFIIISLSCGFARLRLSIEPILLLLSIEFWLKFVKLNHNFKL